jgi:hypothetical protein
VRRAIPDIKLAGPEHSYQYTPAGVNKYNIEVTRLIPTVVSTKRLDLADC